MLLNKTLILLFHITRIEYKNKKTGIENNSRNKIVYITVCAKEHIKVEAAQMMRPVAISHGLL